ncbi:MAG: hypothetical protein C0507_24505 [Cyanobacteria bacterium PR.3.49]|jgi:hypothetical protein|nr:hypothetical protein [Cyanobacteria bacterium PR.3.49]
MELGVRYYDNSSSSGTIAGGEKGMLREHGYRERARTYKDGMLGSHPEYTGVRFMRKAPLMLEVQVSSRSNIRKLRKKQTRFNAFKNFFSAFNIFRTMNLLLLRSNPFATYHAQVRWSPAKQ